MKNFQLITSNANVTSLMNQLQRQDDLWNEFPVRTKHPGTAHSQVSDILVWFNQIPEQDEQLFKVADDRDVIFYRAWFNLPALRPLIFDLMRLVEATRLGRVIITKLPPGKEISPHVDGGAPATYYERFQIALQCYPGNVFKIADEAVSFKSGEVWHINNKLEHSVINNSQDDRIVCIVDLRC